MKRIVVLVSVLILGFGSLGFAKNHYPRLAEKVVVDKTSRNHTLYNYVMLTRDSIQKVWSTPDRLITSDSLKGKVMNLPVAPVLKVEHRTDPLGLTESAQVASQKKYIWGPPAGAALRKDQSIPRDETINDQHVQAIPFPHSMKFQWGVPAGTALRKDQSILRDETVNDKYVQAVPFPHSMKFQWGVNADQ
ncbi:MAG: hypothetical protein ACLQMS_17280 [Desulfomonilaceae bacterium]